MTATAAEQVTGSAMADDVYEIWSQLDEPDYERPVLVTISVTHLVWVDAGYTTKELNRQGSLYEDCHAENAVDWSDSVDDPYDGYEWSSRVYPDETEWGPQDRIEGPTWRCPGDPCPGFQPVGASWSRRHSAACPLAPLPPIPAESEA
jgi:hypothetical protein